MTIPSSPAERHRTIAAGFTRVVDGVTDWSAPTPVAEWAARDVVAHLVEWVAGFLAGGAGVELPPGPAPQAEPAAAWRHHAERVQAVLDDPASADRVLTNPHLGEVPLPEAIDRFYTTDVFFHTWDLARASGQDDGLDPDVCASLVAEMEPLDDMLRASGQYGPRVAVPDDAPAVERLMGFLGRDPDWRSVA